MTKLECHGDWLVDYADGDLAAADSALAERHLAHCPSCSREVALLRKSRERLTTYFAATDIIRPIARVDARANVRIALNNGAMSLASLAATALLALTIFPLHKTGEIVKAIPAPAQPAVDSPKSEPDDDVLAMISRETQIARLRMTSEILAKEPGMNDRHLAIEKYLAEAYGVTKVQKPFEM